MSGWHPIAHTSTQIVLYHPPSNALTVRSRSTLLLPSPTDEVGENGLVLSTSGSNGLVKELTRDLGRHGPCPYCLQYLPSGFIHPQRREPRNRRRASMSSGLPFDPSSSTSHTPPIIPLHPLPRYIDGKQSDMTTPEPTPISSRASTPIGHRHAEVLPLESDDEEEPILMGPPQEDREEDKDATPNGMTLRDNQFDWTNSSAVAGQRGQGGMVVSKPYFRILEQAHRQGGSEVNGIDPQERKETARIDSNSDMSTNIERDRARKRQAKGKQKERGGTGTGQQAQRSNEGYYKRFFVEEKKLGMGAEGSVYLCQHILDDIPLGRYAIKKIAIGQSHTYLHKMLHEVRLLESLRHPNIVGYHHVWIEEASFGRLGEGVASLHMLMMYANAGNLDTYISHRRSSSKHLSLDPTPNDPPTPLSRDEQIESKDSESYMPTAEELKRRFRQRKASMRAGMGREEVFGESRGVMLLSREDLASLFGDIVAGLAFLHANSILHLDLKCSNVLLHRQDDMSIPTAMISDFGTSQEMIQNRRERTGSTGTMEYMAPEVIYPDHLGRFREMDSKVDVWALGLILHKLLYLRLPYESTDNYDDLATQIARYRGYKASSSDNEICHARGFPPALLTMLESMVNVTPGKRPAVSKIQQQLKAMELSGSTPPPKICEELQLLPVRRLPTDFPLRDTNHESILLLPSSTARSMRDWISVDQFKGVIGIIKILSSFPPFRRENIGPVPLLVIVLLASFDLFSHGLVTSITLSVAHVAIVWIG